MTLQGIGASDGIGLGKVLPVRPASLDYSAVVSGGPETERGRLTAAIARFTETTTAMAESLRADVGEKESDILPGQVVMLSDPCMQSQMTDCIDGGQCAEAAVDQVCSSFMAMFAGVDDEMMRQRATDISDIRSRMLSILLGREATDLSRLPENTVLVVHDLTPSMTVGMDRQHVAAIVTRWRPHQPFGHSGPCHGGSRRPERGQCGGHPGRGPGHHCGRHRRYGADRIRRDHPAAV